MVESLRGFASKVEQGYRGESLDWTRDDGKDRHARAH